MDFILLPDETLEDLQIKGLFIIQKKDSFRFGMDAVLLSGFVKARAHQKVLDLGTGAGILPVLISAKTDAKSITGLEIQPDIADMAQRSIDGNNLNHKISIVKGDIKEAVSIFGAAAYDIVVTNPPYTKAGSGRINNNDSKAIAKHEIYCKLTDVLKASFAVLKPKGEFFMVHRPERLTDILAGMRNVRIEPKILRMVCPYQGKAPSLILIKGIKNGNPGLKVLSDLIIYNESGEYTKEARIQYSMDL
jgi:tRNA1Val (adenine37-N6)-methyltransferase